MKLVRGLRPGPLRLVIYGQEKIGKSTFASQAPAAGFVGGEDGSRFLDVARIPWPGATAANPIGHPSWRALVGEPRGIGGARAGAPGLLARIARGEGELGSLQTIVFDTLDALEALAQVEVCREAQVSALEDVGGGYSKGLKRLREFWRDFVDDLDRLQNTRPVNLILIAHAKRITQKNPGGADWGRWGLTLDEQVASMTLAWADEILFASMEIARSGRAKGAGSFTGRRTLKTTTGQGWVAGNRCGLPAEIDLDFGTFWSKRDAALRGIVDAELEQEARDAEAAIPEARRVDAQGRRLLDQARALGPAKLRAFVAWAAQLADTLAAVAATQDEPVPSGTPGEVAASPGAVALSGASSPPDAPAPATPAAGPSQPDAPAPASAPATRKDEMFAEAEGTVTTGIAEEPTQAIRRPKRKTLA